MTTSERVSMAILYFKQIYLTLVVVIQGILCFVYSVSSIFVLSLLRGADCKTLLQLQLLISVNKLFLLYPRKFVMYICMYIEGFTVIILCSSNSIIHEAI